ncbi:hypothetical protein PHYC_02512 [Phycisphaerales bacterium]|nr:hypothetical protein PHYC_02512 [Phycisphaerales bacterium]
MSSIPSNLTRVPNLLSSSISYGSIGRTNLALLRIQQQITSGVEIARPSDDVVRSSIISVLDERLERSLQLQRNFSHADAALGVLDSIFSEAHTLALSAKSIASEQLGASSSAEERNAQATVVDQLIQSLFNTANRQSVAGFALSGSNTGRPAIAAHLAGYRYMGGLSGITTDLGLPSPIPITVGAGNPITNLSSRVRGSTDLNPSLTTDTRIADLHGARGLGVALGSVEFAFNGGPAAQIDLAGTDSVQDILGRITTALRQYETDNSVTILGPGGVSISGGSLTIGIAAGGSLQFNDIGSATAAQDLGLTATTPFAFTPMTAAGLDLDPALTWRTPISSLAGLTGALGQISISNAGRTGVVDLSSATTLGDIRNLIEGSNLGVRVTVNEDGSGIDMRSDLAAGSTNALSITDVVGQNFTATQLGIRSFTASTRVSDFNFGRGVNIVDGQNDPDTNLPSPALNVDFRITLGNAAATELSIDLRPQDMTTVQAVLDRINSEAAAQLTAAGVPTTAFTAELGEGSNGIVLRQDATFTQAVKVEPRNNSPAAEQLGLLFGTYDAPSASLIGQDRAKVRVDGLFSDLIDLRDALRANDVRGITLAGVALDQSIDGLVDARGLVGGYAQRVDQAKDHEESRATSDETTRSVLRDTDFTKAASRLALLQTQLQAGLQIAASAQRVTLLDFLG